MVAVALAAWLGLGAAADAQDCTRATPLPVDTRITAPTAGVPADFAKFAGAWAGRWAERSGASGPCHTLVVEDVFPTGFVRAIYSVGPSEPHVPQPRYWRVAGRIADGVLRFEVPVAGRPEITYRFTGTRLDGAIKVGPLDATVTATRVADLSQVACPRRPATVSPPTAVRDRITAADLLGSGRSGDGPVHNDYFMPVGAAAPARHALRGTLTIPVSTLAGAHEGCAGSPGRLPGFSVEFFTDGEHLVPALREIVRSPGTPDGVILSPGRVWTEPGDQGMSRASFPFVLVHSTHNGTRNGLATFVFDDTRVSQLRVQLTQETMPWARDDYWGQAPMTYVRGAIANEARLRDAFDAERRFETPIKPWSSLPAAVPRRWLDAFDGDSALDDISANGLVVDGVLYVKHCHTRAGPYPYCRHMRHGAFSVTKTLGAGIALLRLAAKYGDGVFDLEIADYVRVTAAHDGWEHVTFGDALSMVVPIGDTGPFRNWPDPEPDENKPRLERWGHAPTAREKLDHGFGYGRYPWARGEVVRYNSTVTFTLAAAMDAFLKRKEGPHAHLWDMVVADVYRPIGILHAPTMHTLEADGSRGIPLFAHGLTPTIDDIARLATLLQQGGRHGGVQILSAAKTAEALDRTGAVGLSTLRRNRFGDQRYHLSFWSEAYRTALGCRFQIPFMAGHGGNIVALLPNGVSAFRFSDGFRYDIETMVLAGEALRPFCTSPPAGVPPNAAPSAPLTAAELAAELPGNTFGTGGLRVFIAPRGVQYLTAGTRVDVGRWRITPDGLYCRAWTVADGGRERCHHVHRDDNAFTFQVHDRWTTFRWMRTRGADSDL